MLPSRTYVSFNSKTYTMTFDHKTTISQFILNVFQQAKVRLNPDDYALVFCGTLLKGETENTPLATVCMNRNINVGGNTTLKLNKKVNNNAAPVPYSAAEPTAAMTPPAPSTPSSSFSHYSSSSSSSSSYSAAETTAAMTPPVSSTSSSSSAMTLRHYQSATVRFEDDDFSIEVTKSMTIADVITQLLPLMIKRGISTEKLNIEHLQLITKDGWSLGPDKNKPLSVMLSARNVPSQSVELQLIQVKKKKVLDNFSSSSRPKENLIFTWVTFNREKTHLDEEEKIGTSNRGYTSGQSFFTTADAALEAHAINVSTNVNHAKLNSTHQTVWREELGIIAAVAISPNQPFFKQHDFLIDPRHEQINTRAAANQEKPSGLLTQGNQSRNMPFSGFSFYPSTHTSTSFDQPGQIALFNNIVAPVVGFGIDPTLSQDDIDHKLGRRNANPNPLSYEILGYYEQGKNIFNALVDPNDPIYQAFFLQQRYMTLTSVNNSKHYDAFMSKQKELFSGYKKASDQNYRITLQTDMRNYENQLKASVYGNEVIAVFFNLFLNFLDQEKPRGYQANRPRSELTETQKKELKDLFFKQFKAHLKKHTIIEDVTNEEQLGGTDIIGYSFWLRLDNNQTAVELLKQFEEIMKGKGIVPVTNNVCDGNNLEILTHRVCYEWPSNKLSVDIIQEIIVITLNYLCSFSVKASNKDSPSFATTTSTSSSSLTKSSIGIFQSPPPFPSVYNNDEKTDLLEAIYVHLPGCMRKDGSYEIGGIGFLLTSSTDDIWWSAVLRATAAWFEHEITDSNVPAEECQRFKINRDFFLKVFKIKDTKEMKEAHARHLKESLDLDGGDNKTFFNEMINSVIKGILMNDEKLIRAHLDENYTGNIRSQSIKDAFLRLMSIKKPMNSNKM